MEATGHVSAYYVSDVGDTQSITAGETSLPGHEIYSRSGNRKCELFCAWKWNDCRWIIISCVGLLIYVWGDFLPPNNLLCCPNNSLRWQISVPLSAFFFWPLLAQHYLCKQIPWNVWPSLFSIYSHIWPNFTIIHSCISIVISLLLMIISLVFMQSSVFCPQSSRRRKRTLEWVNKLWKFQWYFFIFMTRSKTAGMAINI